MSSACVEFRVAYFIRECHAVRSISATFSNACMQFSNLCNAVADVLQSKLIVYSSELLSF